MRSRVRSLACCLAAVVLLSLLLPAHVCAQSFVQPTVIPTGSWPAAIYTSDINGDGYPDLIYMDRAVVPGGPSTTHVLLNDGKGNFKQSAQIATSGDSVAIFTSPGPLNGISWVGATPTGFNVYVAASRGDGTFNPTRTYATQQAYAVKNPPRPGFMTLARLYLGGASQYSPQLIFEDVANSVLYAMLTNPDGTVVFYAASLPDGPGSITLTPAFNPNSQQSVNTIIVTSTTAHVAQVFRNPPGYVYDPAMVSGQPTERLKGISGIESLLVQDVNGDGRADLIVEGANGHIDVLPGNGDGTYQTSSAGGTGALDGLTGNGGHLIALADLNHDGQLDALTSTAAGVSTLLGAGSAYLKLGGIYNAGPGRTSYAVADFNGDGNVDLAVDSPEGIAILYGNPDGSFQSSRAFAAGQPALSVALGSLTGNGVPDAVVSTAATQAQVLLNSANSLGLFNAFGGAGSPVPTSPSAGPAGLWSRVALGDFNGDGKLDIELTADGPNSKLPATGSGLTVQFGDGTGAMSAAQTLVAPAQFTYPNSQSCSPPFDHYPGMFYGDSVVADLNGDGLADIANRDAGAYRIMRGNNGNSGSSFTTLPTLYWSGVDGIGTTVDCNAHAHDRVFTGDLNNDGKADLIFQGQDGSTGSLLVYLTGSTGLLGDLAVDGSLTTPGQMVAPALSTAFGGNSTTLGFPAFIGSAAIADLDGDGNNDLLVTYANLNADPTAPTASAPNYLYIWYGSGGGKFLTSARHPVNPVRVTLSRNYYQVAVADVSGDGIPDLILSDGYLLSYQLGKGDGSFGAEVHLLAGQGINGIAVGDVRGTVHNDLVLANGGLTLSNPVANHEVLTPNPDVNTGGITVLLNGTSNLKMLTGTLTANPEPSVYDSPYTVTATFAGTPAPTGTVTFFVDGIAAGSGTLVNGVASSSATPTTPLIVPGTHVLTAMFAGDANYAAITLTGSHVVTRAPTTVSFTPSTAQTIYYGQFADGNFNVGVVDSAHAAIGNLEFLDNGVVVPMCAALAIPATCPYGNPILLDAGPHAFSAMYLGDPVNAPSTSAPYLFTVLPDLTTVNVTVAQTAVQGTPVLVQGTVAGNFATPSGVPGLAFYDGTTLRGGSGPLANGVGSILLSDLTVGVHCFTGQYAGNQDFNAAVSTTPACVTITPAAVTSAVTVTSNVNPSVLGQAVTFTATISTPMNSGTVTFMDGSTILGQTTIAGSATSAFTVSTLTLGSHPITALFRASGSAVGILSPVLTQVVGSAATLPAGDFTLSVTPNPMVLGVGRTGVLQVTIAGVNGASAEAVSLSCAAGLPPEVSCNFVQATMPAGGGVTTLQLGTKAPRDCGTEAPYALGSNGGLYGGPVLAGLALLFWRRRKRVFLAALLLSVGLLGMSGCGHCTDLGTKPGNYSFTVVATGASPVAATHTATVQLTMTIP